MNIFSPLYIALCSLHVKLSLRKKWVKQNQASTKKEHQLFLLIRNKIFLTWQVYYKKTIYFSGF